MEPIKPMRPVEADLDRANRTLIHQIAWPATGGLVVLVGAILHLTLDTAYLVNSLVGLAIFGGYAAIEWRFLRQRSSRHRTGNREKSGG